MIRNERAPRFCTCHQAMMPIAGGLWIVSNKGKNRRWICANCRARREARLSLKVAA